MELTEHDIAAYLGAHPEFFERHAELLGNVQLLSPHGNRAVSLQERQIELARDKMRQLEHRLTDLIRIAADNDTIAARLADWARALLAQDDAAELPRTVARELERCFELPHAALRLWNVREAWVGQDWAADVGADVPLLAASLAQPYCGTNAGFEAAGWLAAPPASLALIALRASADAPAFGLLVLGSPDAARFTAEMGAEFLVRIGQIASSALQRLVRAD
jgi:uncharacterized protein YigA (DUF484 family)